LEYEAAPGLDGLVLWDPSVSFGPAGEWSFSDVGLMLGDANPHNDDAFFDHNGTQFLLRARSDTEVVGPFTGPWVDDFEVQVEFNYTAGDVFASATEAARTIYLATAYNTVGLPATRQSLWLSDARGSHVLLGLGRTFEGSDDPYPDLAAPAISERGHVAVLERGANVLLKADPGGNFRPLVNRGGFSDIQIHSIKISRNGRIAFRGVLPPSSKESIYVEDSVGGFRQIAKVDELAPGGGAANGDFASFKDFQISPEGLVTFWAQLDNGNDGIWSEVRVENTTTALRLVAREGDAAPEPDTYWDILGGAMANDKGEIFMEAHLRRNSGSPFGTSYWVASFDPTKVDPVFTRVARKFYYDLELPDGRMAGANSIGAFPYNLKSGLGQHPSGAFNADGDLIAYIDYSDPDTFQSVKSVWIASANGIVVNTLSDLPDTNHGDGVADTGEPEINGRPACSLRAPSRKRTRWGDDARSPSISTPQTRWTALSISVPNRRSPS